MYQIITGGIEKCLLRIIEKLVPNNKYDIRIIVKRPIHEKYFIDFFKKYGIKVIIQDSIFNKKIANTILYNSDIIIDYFNCCFWNEISEIPVAKIGVYHSSINFFYKESKEMQYSILNSYDKFICLTDSFKQDVIKYIPEYKNITEQLYNPINVESLQKLANIGEYPKDCDKYFVFLGRFHEDKDHDCVINAFYKFSQKAPNAKIYFLGAGDKQEEYKEKIKNLGLENKIIFTGAIANPYGYLKHSLANILSSPNEGLSNVLIEGAALGVLNISSDCKSSPREVLMDGKAGILYPVGDSNRLSEILSAVWDDKIDKSTYIESGNKNLYRFDSDITIGQFEKNILETINNTRIKYKKTKIKRIIQNIFSIKNFNEHKVITIFGIKLKIKIRRYDEKS